MVVLIVSALEAGRHELQLSRYAYHLACRGEPVQLPSERYEGIQIRASLRFARQSLSNIILNRFRGPEPCVGLPNSRGSRLRAQVRSSRFGLPFQALNLKPRATAETAALDQSAKPALPSGWMAAGHYKLVQRPRQTTLSFPWS